MAGLWRMSFCCVFVLLDEPRRGVELVDERIDLRRFRVHIGPVVLVIPLRIDLLVGFALLLDPGVVLEVVDALASFVGELFHDVRADAVEVLCVVGGGFDDAVCAVRFRELFDAAAVHHAGVRRDGRQHVVLGQLVVLRHLDAAEHVRDAGDAQQRKLR